MSKNPKKHRTPWSRSEVDKLVIWAFEGMTYAEIGTRLDRSYRAVGEALNHIRDAGETFVTYKMRARPGEDELGYERRLHAAADEVRARRDRQRKKKPNDLPTAAPPPEKKKTQTDLPFDAPSPPATNGGKGERACEVLFQIDGAVTNRFPLDSEAWIALLADVAQRGAR